jgi:hypothetical protein
MFANLINLFKKSPAVKELDPTEGQRFNDGVLLVEQNNLSKEIRIKATNSNALKMFGYQNEDIIGKDLRAFLTDAEVVAINDFTEFEDGKKDFAEVLSKMRYFKMLTNNAEYLPLRMRVVRTISEQNAPCFQLVFNDDALRENLERKRTEFRKDMRGNEIYDDLTGLLNYDSVVKDVEILSFYEGKRDSSSYLVTFEIEGYDEVDVSAIRTCLAAAIESCKREEDISARIGDDRFMLILVETPQPNIEVPVGRVKQQFFEYAKAKNFNKQPNLRMNFAKIKAGESAEKQISSLLS